MQQEFSTSYVYATGYQNRKLPVNTAQQKPNPSNAPVQKGSNVKQTQPFYSTTFNKRTPEYSSILNPQPKQAQIMGRKPAFFEVSKSSTSLISTNVLISGELTHSNMEIDGIATNPEIESNPTMQIDSTEQS